MDRFIAFILFALTLPSYFLSFLPAETDSDFTVSGNGYSNGCIMINSKEAPAVKSVTENGEISFDFSNARVGFFNYFAVKYTSDSYIKGNITYTVKAEKHTEEFFLEPGENSVFYSFTDNCLEGYKAYRLNGISFVPLDKKQAEFELLGLGFFNRDIPEENVFIRNDSLKIGVDLNWGGALSYVEDLDSNVQAVKKDGKIYVDSDASERYGVKSINDSVNLINRYDAGRLVQQSYYGTFGGGYECGEYNGTRWNYNPVQGGNKYNECSKIVDIIAKDELLYVKCRPLDWAKPATEGSPSYMEATYRLKGNAVIVSCRFVDFSGYESTVTTQEMPAFYCIEPFNRFVYYSGDKPWSGDETLTYKDDLIFWPDAGYPNFYSTENWAAFTGEFEDSFGIGLYVPNDAGFLAGIFNREQTKSENPSEDAATSYIAAVRTMEFASFKPVEYEYGIAAGTVAQMRESFGQIKGDLKK